MAPQDLPLNALVVKEVDVLAERLERYGEYRQGVRIQKVELFLVEEIFQKADYPLLRKPFREVAHQQKQVLEEAL